VLGELVWTTDGKWITQPPSRCPDGHQLGPGAVLAGHQACLGRGGGHTTFNPWSTAVREDNGTIEFAMLPPLP
jgi:hypothetical protein